MRNWLVCGVCLVLLAGGSCPAVGWSADAPPPAAVRGSPDPAPGAPDRSHESGRPAVGDGGAVGRPAPSAPRPAPSAPLGKPASSAPPNGERPSGPPSTGQATTGAHSAGKPLAAEAQALRDRLRLCLAYHLFRPETAAARAPWGVMHAIVGFGPDTRLAAGDQAVNAIEWLCQNEPCSGVRLFSLERGQVVAPIGVGRQGHAGQFLQIMALSGVPKDFRMTVGGQEFTIADVIKREQGTCQAGTELSFKLVGLAHYLDSDQTWPAQDGETWSLERIIQEELAQPVSSSVACGGTHRLMGLGYAVRQQEQRGALVAGQWARAKQFVEKQVALAFRLQNADGSFSTNWLEGAGASDNVDRRLNTSGHTLEWLLLSLPDEQLTDPRLARAARCLADLLWDHRGRAWAIGPRGHAIHALALYDERVFGGTPGQRHSEWAPLAAAAAEGVRPEPAPERASPAPRRSRGRARLRTR